jgi:hypothetical protein
MTLPTHHTLRTVLITLPGGRQMKGYVLALSMLGPGTAHLTLETPAVLPQGAYEASYNTASQEIGGIFNVSKYAPYQRRWRASGIFTHKWKRRRGIILR